METYKIERKKLYEEVAEILISKIKEGQLNPGDKLPSVEQLSDSFHVGRSAIREALTAMKAMGLIEMKQGEGTYVKHYDSSAFSQPIANALLISTEDIRNLLSVRKILECGIVKEAAIHRTEENCLEIRQTLEMMGKNLSNHEVCDEADILFHLAIAKAAHNPILLQLVDQMSDLIRKAIKHSRSVFSYEESRFNQRIFEGHERVYQAIRERDQQLAQKYMEEHLHYIEKLMGDYLTAENT